MVAIHTKTLEPSSPVRCVSPCLLLFYPPDILLPSLAPQQSTPLQDKLLKKAGELSWKSSEVNLHVRRGKPRRLTQLGVQAPRRQTADAAGKVPLYMTTGKGSGLHSSIMPVAANHDVRTLGIVKNPKPSPPETKESPHALPVKHKPSRKEILSLNLTGEMSTKVAIKITQADGSVFLIRKSAHLSHAGPMRYYPVMHTTYLSHVAIFLQSERPVCAYCRPVCRALAATQWQRQEEPNSKPDCTKHMQRAAAGTPTAG